MKLRIRTRITDLLVGIVVASVILIDRLPAYRQYFIFLVIAATAIMVIDGFHCESQYRKTAFLICPVRGVPEDELEAIRDYVFNLEKSGKKVYWPYRDTDQNDPVGVRICSDNREALKRRYEIHVWWNGKSEGSFFDLGEAFGLEKKIVLANPGRVGDMVAEEKRKGIGKSFNKFLFELHRLNSR